MDKNLDLVLNFEEDRDLLQIDNVNYLFHEASESGVLNKVLSKLPRSEKIKGYVNANIVECTDLEEGWELDLLSEINSLIALFENPDLLPLTKIQAGTADNGSDAMFALRGEMYYLFSDNFDDQISETMRDFLIEFFFGIDFNYWCGWAVLLQYTNLQVGLLIALKAQRNNINFSIFQNILIIDKP